MYGCRIVLNWCHSLFDMERRHAVVFGPSIKLEETFKERSWRLLTDNHPLSERTERTLFSYLSLTITCLIVFDVAQALAGSYLLPIIDVVLEPNSSLFISYVILALHFIANECWRGRETRDMNLRIQTDFVTVGLEVTVRGFEVVWTSMGAGLLSGFSLVHRSLPSPVPKPRLLHVTIGLMSYIVDRDLSPDRINYLIVLVAPSVLVSVIAGLVQGGGWPFLMYLAFSAAVSMLVLQLVVSELLCILCGAVYIVLGDVLITSIIAYTVGHSLNDTTLAPVYTTPNETTFM